MPPVADSCYGVLLSDGVTIILERRVDGRERERGLAHKEMQAILLDSNCGVVQAGVIVGQRGFDRRF